MLNPRLIDIFIDSFPKILIPGLTATLPLTALSFALAMVIAVAAALIQYAQIPVLKQICRFYIWVIRGTPLLVQLFLVFYGLARVGLVLSPFPAAVLTFSINEGAYCAETIRGALESIPAGQLEAGRCLGLSWLQTVRAIILPQAMRAAVPSLSNSLIAMVKDTSLVSNITMTEMFRATVQINASVYEPLLLYSEVALVYLMFSTVLTWLQHRLENRLGSYAL